MQVWNLKAIFEFQALVNENSQATAVLYGRWDTLSYLAGQSHLLICTLTVCTVYVNRSHGKKNMENNNFKVTLRETVECVRSCRLLSYLRFLRENKGNAHSERHTNQWELSTSVVEIIRERRLPPSLWNLLGNSIVSFSIISRPEQTRGNILSLLLR